MTCCRGVRPIPALCMLLAMFWMAAPSQAQTASADSIRELLVLTDADKLSRTLLQRLVPTLQQLLPDAPDAFWRDFIAEVDHAELEAMIIPIYQQHLSEEDVRQLVAFYSTPVGRKLVRLQPVIAEESLHIGQDWGRNLALKAKAHYQAYKGTEN